MIARQIPHDPFRPEMVFAPQMQNLLCHLRRCLIGRIFWNGFGIAQFVQRAAAPEACAAPRARRSLSSKTPPSITGIIQKVSRETLHVYSS